VVLVATTLLVLGGTSVASADPQIVTITATCDGGVPVTVTTIINNSAPVSFVDGTVAHDSTSIAIVEAATSSTLGQLRVAPPGLSVNGLATTICTFTVPGAPQVGTITAQILFTPVKPH
jgi:hypothetical protein